MSGVAPSRTEICRWVFAETDRLRVLFRWAMQPDRSNRFEWSGCELWIDRVRHMALSAAAARRIGCYELDSVPIAAQDELAFLGVRDSTTKPRRMLSLLAAHLNQVGDERTTASLWAEYVNFAVAQPLVNAAFQSLFWLSLEVELEQRRDSSELADVVGNMAMDLATYPRSRSQALDARVAQIAFVRESFLSSIDDVYWRAATEQDWAIECDKLLQAQRIEHVVAEVEDLAARQIGDAKRGYL